MDFRSLPLIIISPTKLHKIKIDEIVVIDDLFKIIEIAKVEGFLTVHVF